MIRLVGMSDKKYSVFISSTFDDLKEQRAAVLNVVLQNGHFPLGMELWGAADEQQWQIIQRQIDVADYYVVIIAHRYGSQYKGLSWTEKEYNYAVEKGVPVLGFILDKDTKWEPPNIEKGNGANKLESFRKKVRKKPVDFWKDTDDLKTKVVLALNRQIQSTPRIGWIRANEGMTSVTANELARLSEENSRLREENSRLTRSPISGLAFEVERAVVSARANPQPEGKISYAISVDATFNAAITAGPPIGFKPSTALLVISFGDESILTRIAPTIRNERREKPSVFIINSPTPVIVRGDCVLDDQNIALLDQDEIKLSLTLLIMGIAKKIALHVSLVRSTRPDQDPHWACKHASLPFETIE
jgi:hypothetical protein